MAMQSWGVARGQCKASGYCNIISHGAQSHGPPKDLVFIGLVLRQCLHPDIVCQQCRWCAHASRRKALKMLASSLGGSSGSHDCEEYGFCVSRISMSPRLICQLRR